MAKDTLPRLVHELRDGLHRIVVFTAEDNQPGAWATQGDIATSADGKYFAVTGESPLPQGVFTVREQVHQVLS